MASGQLEFLNHVCDFWYSTIRYARHLRRGELWWVMSSVDGHLKSLLERILEWYARAGHSQGADGWLRGRFLEQWADPRAVAELPNCFAHYEKSDVWNSLIATMNVFSWVSRETAQAFQLSYPDLAEEKATQIVQQLVRQVNQQDEKPEIIGRSRCHRLAS